MVSDLHFEFDADRGASYIEKMDPTGVDVLILAGDVGSICGYQDNRLIPGLARICTKYKHVVYVTGNHEYYYTARSRVHQNLREFEAVHPNFHWLDGEKDEIDGQEFIGATLWYPDDPMAAVLRSSWSDFQAIPHLRDWVYVSNRADEKFIKSFATKNTIVVTHFLPSRLSVSAKWKTDKYTAFYVTDMSNWLAESGVKLWVHGHTHDTCDYVLGDTRVVCNPRGYSHLGENLDHKPVLIDI